MKFEMDVEVSHKDGRRGVIVEVNEIDQRARVRWQGRAGQGYTDLGTFPGFTNNKC